MAIHGGYQFRDYKVIVIILAITTFVFWLSTAMIRPIYPLYLDELGFSAVEIGIIVAIPQLISIFLRIPLSGYAGRIGKNIFLASSLLLNGLALILYYLAVVKLLVIPARIIHSIPIAAFGPVAFAYVSLVTPEEKRGSVMGTYMTAVALSIMLGPLLTSIITEGLDLRMTFIVAGVPSILLSGLLLIIPRDMVYESSYNGGARNIYRSIRRVLSNRGFLLICISALAYSSSMGFFRSFFPLFMQNTYGVSESYISFLYFIRGVLNVLVRPVSGVLTNVIGVGIQVYVGLLLSSLSYLMIGLVPGLEVIMIALGIMGFAWGIRAVSSVSFISLYLPEEDQDVGMAIFYNMFDLGVSLGSIIGGFLSGIIPLETLFLIFSIVIFIGSVTTIPLLRMGKKDFAGHIGGLAD